MNTPLIDQEAVNTPSVTNTSAAARRPAWKIVAGVAAAAVVALGSAAIINSSRGDGGSEVAAGTPLELSLGESNSMSSCIVFDVALLADMAPAFAATATAVEGESVTLNVDRWYAGGDAATVVLHGAVGSPALIDGFEFQVGEKYLITAAEGNVNFCGYSGLATPELTAAFEAAFGG
ncbi:MAG: hypothetical protein ABL953_09990 [Ilumatobacteraceae bacterium]